MKPSAKNIVLLLVSGAFVFFFSHSAMCAEKIILQGAVFDDGRQDYHYELLHKALEQIGYELELEELKDIPQERMALMLDQEDSMFFHWFVQTKERDERWIPIDVGLTNSLIGHRILFIPQGQQDVYNGVNTLDDFRALAKVGAFGKTWYDVRVWEQNDLKYYGISGDWKRIYHMLEKGDRGIDYFSRGFSEILGEAPLYPNLDIEQRLMFIYDRDFRFYLGKAAGKAYKDILRTALLQAKESGLIDTLIRKHFSENFEKLHFDERINIHLKNPVQ